MLTKPSLDLVAIDTKLDFLACERKGIDTVGIIVIVRTRVGGKNLTKGFKMRGVKRFEN